MNKTAYIYVDEHVISPSLICPICLDILEDPHTHTYCDSAFCRSCLLQLADSYCPICRWTWDDTIPIQYNIDLPKANRLIRNMLDDLPVKCIYCHTIRRRGQFEHDCRPTGEILMRKTIEKRLKKKLGNNQTVLSALGLVLFIVIIYFCRDSVFEKVTGHHREMVKNVGYDIDYFLLDKIYYLSKTIVEYSMTFFTINICFWFSIIIFGDRFTSKTNSRILKTFLEVSMIINLITYSFSN
ncbi:unnamed protein product [Rotaria magnacalcarata]|uniref:RING-type domain-containing protein n=3 Tax=Rotaria magnacalcarata TaxID=392030 RepID=A0A816DWC7_9BILA|nr:unnamed protein product [Rotaria magnacalcarata]CAF1641202.1 unnamed protein product [Rotaria magnacalcarata]CAF2044013.1 unnamed protein product [Rotaria magnacalcarata]CAF2055482.1 unnamed protein product [Rotaria magnacalcarata]CAF2106477.1 unnamed protein product [Rotaria magnacalcarata]